MNRTKLTIISITLIIMVTAFFIFINYNVVMGRNTRFLNGLFYIAVMNGIAFMYIYKKNKKL